MIDTRHCRSSLGVSNKVCTHQSVCTQCEWGETCHMVRTVILSFAAVLVGLLGCVENSAGDSQGFNTEVRAGTETTFNGATRPERGYPNEASRLAHLPMGRVMRMTALAITKSSQMCPSTRTDDQMEVGTVLFGKTRKLGTGGGRRWRSKCEPAHWWC